MGGGGSFSAGGPGKGMYSRLCKLFLKCISLTAMQLSLKPHNAFKVMGSKIFSRYVYKFSSPRVVQSAGTTPYKAKVTILNSHSPLLGPKLTYQK